MFGRPPALTALQSRKQLLLAESELNRAQLVQDWQAVEDDIHALTIRARSITSFATAAVSLVAGLVSFRRKNATPVDEKPSWLKKILNGAQFAAALWSEFRSPPNPNQKP